MHIREDRKERERERERESHNNMSEGESSRILKLASMISEEEESVEKGERVQCVHHRRHGAPHDDPLRRLSLKR